MTRWSGNRARPGLRACLAALPALAATGCISNVHTPYQPGEDSAWTQVASGGLRPFEYTRSALAVDNHSLPAQETRDYRMHRLRIPSHGRNGQPDDQVTALYYESKREGPRPLVIVLPVWGTYTYPPDKISKELRSRSQANMNVLHVLGENYLFDWDAMAAAPDEQQFLALARRGAEHVFTTVIDVRRLIDWALARAEVDPARIGLIGFSMGAYVASLVITNDARTAATVLVMGGARPAEIFAACDGRLGEVRAIVTSRFGWTRERYKSEFERILGRGDPALFPGRVDPARILMIDSYYDDCMPAATRDALWTTLGRPERISFRYSHKMSFLAMTPLGFNYMGRKIYGFFEHALR